MVLMLVYCCSVLTSWVATMALMMMALMMMVASYWVKVLSKPFLNKVKIVANE